METPSQSLQHSLSSPLAWTVLVWALVGMSGAFFASGNLALPKQEGAHLDQIFYQPIFRPNGPTIPAETHQKGSRLS